MKKNYKLTLSKETGNIVSFINESGFDYIECETPLVTLSLLDKDGNRTTVSNGLVDNIVEESNKTTIYYSNFGGLNINVTAFLTFDGLDFIKMRLKIENNSNLRLECSLYPGITIKNRLGYDDYRLFWPAMEGVEIINENFRTELMSHADYTIYPAKGWQGVYPGACPMQYMAYYNGINGLYLASHDESSRVKLIEWKIENNGIRLIEQVYIDEESNVFEYDYDVVLGVFKGNYYDASNIYREWLYSSKILSFNKLIDNKELPKWMFEPLTVITFPIRGRCDTDDDKSIKEYYPYTKCLPYIDKYQKYFNNRQMVLLMHWEGTAPWAPPYVWPPYGEKKYFDELEKGIHDKDNLFGLYCSGLGWTQRHLFYPYNREEDFKKYNIDKIVERGPKRNLEYTTTCFHIRNGYELCPACSETKEIARKEALNIAKGTNLDYIQFFDQDLGGNTYPCYSNSHGHIEIPGRWMAQSMSEISDIMRNEFKKYHPDKNTIIGCEAAACEPLLDKLRFNDIRYNLDLMYGIPVPMYHYCFGEYVVNFMGNHTTATRLLDTKKYPDNIFYRTAYSFAQGDILTFMIKNDGKINWEWNVPWNDDNEPDQEEYLRYSKMLNDLRNGPLYNHLRYGKMIKPLNVKCGKYIEKIDRANLVRELEEIVSTRYIFKDKDVQIFVNFNNSEKTFNVDYKNGKILLLDGNIVDIDGRGNCTMPGHTAGYLIIE